MEQQGFTKFIDIEKTLKEREDTFLSRLPSFAMSIIARIIKQKELNRVLNKMKPYEGVEFLEQMLKEYNIKVEVDGIENLPDNPKNFFAANHPFGFLDGLIITSIIGKKYGKLHAIGNDSFRFIPNLNSLITNVNVFGKNSREGLLALDKIYSSDNAVTHFPYGLVSRVHKFKVRDKVWKKSFITKAIQHNRNVVPIRFYGRNSNLFYFIYILRSLFGIKATIELILLPREFFRKKGSTIRVKIHPVIESSSFDKSKSHSQWAEHIKNQIYNEN
jgi:putative hemolysin